MPLNKQQLIAAMPALSSARADQFLPHLNAAMGEFAITTTARQAPFLAQLAHETAQLATFSENLNYSADGLANTWPSRFAGRNAAGEYIVAAGRKIANGVALKLARQPEAIANNVYANRMGNGDEKSGDGWRYRGAGAFQLTGRDNHDDCAHHFRIPVEQVGDWLRTPEGAMRSAAWFWHRYGCNALADAGKFDAISDVINLGRITPKVGDSIGYADRLKHFNHIKKVLA